jgi:addiction module RelE/StbE family toxin
MIVWSTAAAQQLEDLDWFLIENYPQTADDIMYRIHSSIGTLKDFPQVGRLGRSPGTRELIIPGTPYLAIYRLEGKNITIVALLHGAQRWPR